jgi:CheY-like chemotaxis protein
VGGRIEAAMSQTTVLIVDDQRPVSQLMERMLTRAGYHVVAAEDAASALALARANLETLGLAIVDANLGEVHGDEVLAALWALLPTLPLVTMSGGLEAEHRLPGVVAHLSKPFVKADLVRLVQSIAPAAGGPGVGLDGAPRA